MSTRRISFTTGEFYHIYNRGTDKRVIFKDRQDYGRFVQLLYLCNSDTAINVRSTERSGFSVFDFQRGKQLVYIGVYCLMPNHFHILVTPNVDEGISTFMNKLCTSYSMYFNNRYERSGGLFEGPFKAEHADSDEYLKYLFSYIHLNPVKLIQSDWKDTGIRDIKKSLAYLENYTHSSFSDYAIEMQRDEIKILNKEKFPLYFATHTDFKREIFDWLTFAVNKNPHRVTLGKAA